MSKDSGIALVTDSTASITPADRERLGVEVVNLYVILNGKEQPENEIPDYGEFYREVIESPTPTTTSQPSVGDFMEVYEPLLEQGKEIVSVHLSAAISGTCESARQAAEQLEAEGKGGERITVVDSKISAGGLAFAVLVASNAIADGANVTETVDRVMAAREGMENWIAVDTLDYLKKGGRIGGAEAWIGSALKVKPIITLKETVEPIEKVRTRAKAMWRLRDIASEKAASGIEYVWTAQHIQAPERAAELADHCREVFGNEGVFLDEMSTVLGCHAGPGLVALGVVPAELVGTGR